MKRYTLHEPAGKIETHIDFKGSLNKDQYDVATRADGPCLVLAGAGSGKTQTLIYRLAYLLEKGIPPENILLMTFTNKAAREMRDRTEMLLRYSPKGLWSGTFHHVGNRSLRIYAEEVGYTRDFGILDQHDSRDLIKTCIKKMKTFAKDEKFPKPSVVQSIISLSTNISSSVEDTIEDRYPYFTKFGWEIKKIKEEYEKKKKESGNMDYDDLLSKWKWLLKNVPSVKKRFSEQFRYIMVDEYQDTNSIQADIVDILGSCHRNILAVGDDAQSIYSFRGAKVENILNFPKKFKDTKIFKLVTNYRSTPEILELANDSLLNNENQFHKELMAVNASIEKPALVKVKDPYSQARFISQRVIELKNEGIRLDDIAVLFRAHYQSAELEMELVKKGIPYVVRGGIRFFEQAHIKDVLAYMKVAINPLDEVAWIRALSLCPGIGPGYAEKIYLSFRSKDQTVHGFITGDLSKAMSKKAYSGFTRFRRIIERITASKNELSPGEMIRLILDEGYETHLLSSFENGKDRVEDIHELMSFSNEYATSSDFLSDITLRENFKGETFSTQNEDDDQLILSTIHQAKGLEWDSVILIGLCEGQFPHPKAMAEDAEMEEERRLFYVAVTRAKRYLYMIHPATRYDYQKGTVIAGSSRFLKELNKSGYEVWEVDSSASFFGRQNGHDDYDDFDDY
ncbi:MAG: ATP-dependent helicase [Candidatus Aadella gelida]|nr:ATP-dependent helicase [Candidatus Aadella gelida]